MNYTIHSGAAHTYIAVYTSKCPAPPPGKFKLILVENCKNQWPEAIAKKTGHKLSGIPSTKYYH